jgi:hypothetical protein
MEATFCSHHRWWYGMGMDVQKLSDETVAITIHNAA